LGGLLPTAERQLPCASVTFVERIDRDKSARSRLS
jgi:hypothetical protein